MGETTGDQPAGGIRASDAEREATVERLAGPPRTAADAGGVRPANRAGYRSKTPATRRLVADLPAEPAVAGAVAAPASAPATWHVSPVGGLRVSGRGGWPVT